eukprot:TRINITY_DN5910_c0_g1_i2.p1 TRINITY_DN5910_c0_g1~~TRINITY_DN5910_c0_g1_i2.p1  ORF type:complete len:355 (+),score=62.73 TRINITY_DN5910_c0_g1_i2:415-1479(+)
MNPSKKLVVVGGGVAGADLAKALQFEADITLIDPKDYYEVPYAMLRCLVEPKFAERSVFNHKQYLLSGRLVVNKVVNATDSEVITANGDRYSYDYLVIASGSEFSGPSTREERLRQIEAENQKIRNSQTILIIGGGPVGVELAAEIKVDYPEKKVIIVHSGSRLIEFLGQKASQKALDWLTAKNIDVHLNERIALDNLSESTTTFTTSSGKVLSADCHFVCIGTKVGSPWLRDSVFKDAADGSGRLKVNEHLQVLGRNNVFAIGDIVNVKENKQGFSALKHAQVAAGNIKKLLTNPQKKLDSYKAMSPLGVVSLGRHEAVAQLPFVTTIGRIPGMIKSKDLFVGKTRKGLGLSA